MRVNKSKNFTIMSNYHFSDMRLSLKAKGLLSQMLSLPDDWDYSLKGLAKINKENITAIKSAIDELIACGYIVRTKLMPNETEDGRIAYVYDIFELPRTGEEQPQQSQDEQPQEVQQAEKQGIENLCLENPHQINTNIQNTKNKNIDSNESILAQPEPSDGEQKFGNSDVADAVALWHAATGYDYSSNKFERQAIYNLMRRKDILSLGGFKVLVKLVKEARRECNRFAPKIAKPSELGGKYSKFEKLIDWAKQERAARQRTADPQSDAFKQQLKSQNASIIGTYYREHAYLHEPITVAEDDATRKAGVEKAREIFEAAMRGRNKPEENAT